MASAIALNGIRGLSQNVHRFAPFLSLTASNMGFEGCHWSTGNSMLIERWNCPQLNFQSINGSLQNPFWRLSMIEMVQTCVHFENCLGLRLRLKLRPSLLNLNEFFRKFGYDDNKNLIFNAKYFHIKQWCTNGTFWVYENLIVTLYNFIQYTLDLRKILRVAKKFLKSRSFLFQTRQNP